MHPAAGLCWVAGRRTPAPEDVARFAAQTDLEFLADVAITQRFSPMLARALRAAAMPVPPSLDADAARCAAQARLLFPSLDGLLFAPLRAAGFEPLLIKGVTLAERYPSVGLRPMDDIDMVLPATDIHRAVLTLRNAGWIRVVVPQEEHEVHLVHPQLPGLPVDLHREMERSRDRTSRLTTEQLWEARRPATVQGATAFVLPPELELVMLSAHAAKPFHSFGRLIWAIDVAMAITSGDAIDWELVERHADSARLRTALAVMLTQAERLGADSPAKLRALPDNAQRREALAAVVSADWPITPRDAETRWNLRYSAVDDPQAIANLVLNDLFRAETPVEAVRRAGSFLAAGARRLRRG